MTLAALLPCSSLTLTLSCPCPAPALLLLFPSGRRRPTRPGPTPAALVGEKPQRRPVISAVEPVGAIVDVVDLDSVRQPRLVDSANAPAKSHQARPSPATRHPSPPAH
ncbi:hypothetical protein LX32DRAFT_643904, partial [Colletotrichum zoysiae]